ncbi:hypothetical protein [uncultured Bacteroides sp.]|uniref:hypothetical protein n=1 Tax=uncultured Bacteroides sp. TaxID=162156 RepID=UPI00260A51FE|nr:hypothetical protein [uncultured Bacteroides sp.]
MENKNDKFELSNNEYKIYSCDKRQIKDMRKKLIYNIVPYPKGDNMRYDASFTPYTQGMLF